MVRNPLTFGVLSLLASFAAPTLMMVDYGFLGRPLPMLDPAVSLIGLLGSGHVIITAALYFDRGARDVFAKDRRHYYGVPSALILISAAAFMALPGSARHYAVMAFYLTAFPHHARQNIGVYSFMSRAFRLGKVSIAEKRAISMAFLGALFCGARWYAPPSLSREILNACYDAGLVLFAVTIGYALLVARVQHREHGNLRRTGLFLSLCLFFAPAMVFSNWQAGLAFGAAHGLQYHLFLYYALYRPNDKKTWIAVASLWALAWPAIALYLVCLVYMKAMSFVPNIYAGGLDTLVFGLVIGWVLSHYAVDAKIWRMSDPLVRRYQERAFGFLRAAAR